MLPKIQHSKRKHVPIVILKTEGNNKLNQLLDTEFERVVYWNG